jgi:hypothetical protein
MINFCRDSMTAPYCSRSATGVACVMSASLNGPPRRAQIRNINPNDGQSHHHHRQKRQEHARQDDNDVAVVLSPTY